MALDVVEEMKKIHDEITREYEDLAQHHRRRLALMRARIEKLEEVIVGGAEQDESGTEAGTT